MNRHFTVMIVPERGQGVRSFKIPRMVFQASLFTLVALVLVLSVLAYDYWEILRQVYANRHLSVENRQLKEQVQLFNMKLNTLTEDIDRMQTFEKKLRVITGIEQIDMTEPLEGEAPGAAPASQAPASRPPFPGGDAGAMGRPGRGGGRHGGALEALDDFKNDGEYARLLDLYEDKVATAFGLGTGHAYTRELSQLTRRGFQLADRYAEFDHKFNVLKSHARDLENGIHRLDRFLIDKDSFLKSTPTLLPTKGWITSYYGPRISPTSNRMKMHEGIDIGARSGTPIIAPADGRVVYSGRRLGFGNFVQIDHGYGVETIYAHAKTLAVQKGQVVSRGAVLASIGSTGYSTGPHVHYEVRVNGTPVDPLFFILD